MLVILAGPLVVTSRVPHNRGVALGDQGFRHIDSTDGDGAAGFLREARLSSSGLPGSLDVVYHHVNLLANQLLPQELPSLKHEGNVVERLESFLAPHRAVLWPGWSDEEADWPAGSR